MAYQWVTVAFALLAFTQFSHAMHMSSSSRRLASAAPAAMRNTRVDAADGDKRFTGAMAARLCDENDDDDLAWNDVAWTFVVGSESMSCSCECDADECTRASCQEGYDLGTNEETGEPECVRVETEDKKVIEGEADKVACAPGRLEVSGGSARCVMPSECPPPPSPGGETVVLGSRSGCEDCQFPVQCVHPAHLIVNGTKNTAVCKMPAETTEATSTRTTEPAQVSCPDGGKPFPDGFCRIKPVKCPPVLMLSPSVLACGPKTDAYIEHMLLNVARVTKELVESLGKPPSKPRVGCETTCQSVFAKFSECADQNNAIQCVGRAAGSGRAIRAIGSLAVADTSEQGMPWLKKLKKGGASDKLPCKDMYGSEYNFKKGWLSGVEKIEGLAAKNYLLLHGDYVRKPVGALDCRQSVCKKVDHYAASQPSEERALAQCMAQCAEQYPQK